MERVGEVLVETYRIERLIAEGGMASVYEARHVRVPRRFAVKFLKLSFVNNAEALARFRREAEVIASFDHPNIVYLVDYNVGEDGVPFIVLEFLDGENLGMRVARGPLPPAEALPIARAVGSALSAAHAHEVVHRDLKPENVMLCHEVVKVLDFGVAKLRTGPQLTEMNTTVGTVAYMSPEQVTGQAIDERTDQFALGLLLYEMLSGTNPFDGGNIGEQAMRILNVQPPPIAGVDPKLNMAIARALAKAPEERYPSVVEFLAELEPEPPILPDERTEITPAPLRLDDLDGGSAPVITNLQPLANDPEAPLAPSPTQLLQRDRVVPADVGSAPTDELKRNELLRNTLPPISSMGPPRVTAKSMTAVVSPMAPATPGKREWPLWLYAALGVAVGGSVLTAIWLLALR
jgi:serine/threonine-protein kinase